MNKKVGTFWIAALLQEVNNDSVKHNTNTDHYRQNLVDTSHMTNHRWIDGVCYSAFGRVWQ